MKKLKNEKISKIRKILSLVLFSLLLLFTVSCEKEPKKTIKNSYSNKDLLQLIKKDIPDDIPSVKKEDISGWKNYSKEGKNNYIKKRLKNVYDYKKTEKETVENGDTVKITYRFEKNGVPDRSTENDVFYIKIDGKDELLPNEKELIGKEYGETFEIENTGTYKGVIHGIYEAIPVDESNLNDDVCKSIGYATVDDFYRWMKIEYKEMIRKQNKQKYKEYLIKECSTKGISEEELEYALIKKMNISISENEYKTIKNPTNENILDFAKEKAWNESFKEYEEL